MKIIGEVSNEQLHVEFVNVDSVRDAFDLAAWVFASTLARRVDSEALNNPELWKNIVTELKKSALRIQAGMIKESMNLIEQKGIDHDS